MQALLKFFSLVFSIALLGSCRYFSSAEGWDHGFSYGPDSTYSRAIAGNGNKIYIGNSDGFIYKLNLRTKKSKKISKHALPELRDIHVIGRNQVVAMQSADTSQVIYLKGRKEKIDFVSCETDSTGWVKVDGRMIANCKIGPLFLDGMDILPSGNGFMMGDPIKGHFSVFMTSDAGRTWWQRIDPSLKADEGEAGFAASGTTVQCLNDSTFLFVSGGMRSRFFQSTDSGKNWTFVDLPFEKSAASGPFSMLFINSLEGVVVGGDYTKPEANEKTSFYTQDGGKTWMASEKPVSGYRSSVVEMNNVLYASGTNGIDYSTDRGKTWQKHYRGNYIKLLVIGERMFSTIPEGRIVEVFPYDPMRIMCGG